ncbi:cation transporter, partial [candidate division KSB1 bacterium]
KYREGQRAATIGIILNFILASGKIFFGIIGKSSALITDGIHSASDIITSFAVFLGMKIAKKPPDKEHPYGHGKAENIAAKTVAIILIFVSLEIVYLNISHITDKHIHLPASITVWVAIASIVLKEGLFQYKISIGRKINSSSLISDAWHHRSDAFSSLIVLVGITGAKVGGTRFAFLDNVAAIIVGVIILVIGIKLFIKTSAELMDKMPENKILKQINTIALSVEGVKDTETLKARKIGLDIFVDIHIEVDKDITVKEGHNIARNVKNVLKERIPLIKDVLVHIEPFYPDDHIKNLY